MASLTTNVDTPPTRDAILARADRVASLPVGVQQVLAEIASDRSTANSVADILGKDPPLAANVLRVANSPVYGGLTKSSQLQHAVVRIGVGEVRNIVVNTAVVSAFGLEHDQLRDLYLQALVAALATPTIFAVAKKLPKTTGANPYFVPALLHDLGLFVLARFASPTYARCLALANNAKRPLAEIEKKVFGYTHTDIGAAVLTKWRMAPSEVEACRWHHAPAACPPGHRAVVHVVWLADCVTQGALAARVAQVLKSECDPRALAFMGIDEPGTRQLIGGYQKWLEQAREIERAMKPAA